MKKTFFVCFYKIDIKRVGSGIGMVPKLIPGVSFSENTLYRYWFHTDTSTVIGMDASAVFLSVSLFLYSAWYWHHYQSDICISMGVLLKH